MTHFDRLFRSAEIEAEALIGVARMLVAAILGSAAFLLILQQGMPTETDGIRGLTIAAIVLGAYFVLGAISVLIVRFGFYRTSIAWILAIAEIALIAANIHIATSAAGASSLAALASPAGYLVAVFLVLQTLRYRLIFQIATSLLLVFAIVFILLIDPGTSETPRPETLSFLATTYAGIPNFVRVIMLLLVMGIAALSVWRGRRLLAEVAAEAEIRANQKRFLPDELSTQMTDVDIERMRTGRTAELVIMFVDVRDFTALSETMEPRELSAFLSEFRSRITKVVSARGGVVDKFIGDGALIVFGLKTDLSSASANAMRASQEALDELATWNAWRKTRQMEPVRVAIAVHAGEVMVGAIGDDQRLEFSVIGSPVNEASRIEAVAKKHDSAVVVSSAVIDSAGRSNDFKKWRRLGEIELRGSSSPVDLFAIE